eukprot:3423867-Pleurochrysis_carterae.AAC.1
MYKGSKGRGASLSVGVPAAEPKSMRPKFAGSWVMAPKLLSIWSLLMIKPKAAACTAALVLSQDRSPLTLEK